MNSCPDDPSSSVEPDCVTAEVNIVEEDQNMWRRVKRGTDLQLDAWRRSALLLSSQRVNLHFTAESLVTSTVKNALSRTPRQALPASEYELDPETGQVPDLTAEEERRLLASLVQTRKNLRILRTMHLQEPFVSLVVAQLHFAQYCSCDAMCARVNIILDPTCLRDFAQTESLVTEQPLICLCSQIMLATS